MGGCVSFASEFVNEFSAAFITRFLGFGFYLSQVDTMKQMVEQMRDLDERIQRLKELMEEEEEIVRTKEQLLSYQQQIAEEMYNIQASEAEDVKEMHLIRLNNLKTKSKTTLDCFRTKMTADTALFDLKSRSSVINDITKMSELETETNNIKALQIQRDFRTEHTQCSDTLKLINNLAVNSLITCTESPSAKLCPDTRPSTLPPKPETRAWPQTTKQQQQQQHAAFGVAE